MTKRKLFMLSEADELGIKQETIRQAQNLVKYLEAPPGEGRLESFSKLADCAARILDLATALEDSEKGKQRKLNGN